MTALVMMFVAGLLTGLVCGSLVVWSLVSNPIPARLTHDQAQELTRIRTDLMALHAQMAEDDDTLPSLRDYL